MWPACACRSVLEIDDGDFEWLHLSVTKRMVDRYTAKMAKKDKLGIQTTPATPARGMASGPVITPTVRHKLRHTRQHRLTIATTTRTGTSRREATRDVVPALTTAPTTGAASSTPESGTSVNVPSAVDLWRTRCRAAETRVRLLEEKCKNAQDIIAMLSKALSVPDEDH